MVNNIEILNIYERQNKDIPEYKDIFFETDTGMLRCNGSIYFEDCNELREFTRIEEINMLRQKYGRLYINEARKTYDNNIYILISNKFILAIEYILNSSFTYSLQELSVIEDIYDSNKTELDEYKELEIIKIG